MNPDGIDCPICYAWVCEGQMPDHKRWHEEIDKKIEAAANRYTPAPRYGG